VPMSMAQLREQLSAIEPDESTYADISAAEVDLLRQLLDDEEPWLAARAVHALSRIDDESAHSALLAASQSSRPELRTAVAASAHALPPSLSDDILSRLLRDSEVGVRKFAIHSTSERNSDVVRARLIEVAGSDVNTTVRQIAEKRARLISPP
jgi:HEAT repeat protein